MLQNFVLNMVVQYMLKPPGFKRADFCSDVYKMQSASLTVIYNKIQDSEKHVPHTVHRM